MDNLPIELLSFIFKQLGLVDLLRSRSVCKKWRFFIDEQKIKELTIFKYEFDSKNWAKTNQLIDLDNTIRLDTLRDEISSDPTDLFQNHLINLNQLSDLKRLKIYCMLQSYIFDQFLNKFPKLEQLDIDTNLYTVIELNHQNLRILSIAKGFEFLRIDAPKLKILIYGSYANKFELVYPNTLIELHISYSGIRENIDLSPYSNVELLNCYSVESNQNIISVLPKLKELYFRYDFSKFRASSLVKNLMKNQLEQNQNLNRSVEIYFQDLLLSDQTDLKLFDESLATLSDQLFLQIKNYSLLSKSNLKTLNYTILLKRYFKDGHFLNSSIDKLPNDFLNKFPNINFIYINEIQDQIQFSWFLKNCTNLIGLSMNETLFDQTFYNNLPDLCGQLSHFRFFLTDQILNLDFILKFNRLITLNTNQRVANPLAIEFFRTFKYLNNIRFKDNDLNIIETKKDGSKFDLTFYYTLGSKIIGKRTGTELNLNELIIRLCQLSTNSLY